MSESIRSLLTATPFEPFTIHMPHGWDRDIDCPEIVKFSPHGCSLYVHARTGELQAVLSLRHVSSITFTAKPIIREG